MKSSTITNNSGSILMFFLATIVLLEVTSTYAAPQPASYPGYYSPLEGQNPEYILQTIARLRQALYADDDLENVEQLIAYPIDNYEENAFNDQHEDHVPNLEYPKETFEVLKRSFEFQNKNQERNRLFLDQTGKILNVTSKRKLDAGTERGYSGQREHNLRLNKYFLDYTGRK